MRPFAGIVALLFACPAVAQQGPSFDCAKASNEIERTICGDGDLATADRQMAAVYGVLAGKLGAPAKEHLVKDQGQWIASRDRLCATQTYDAVHCLKSSYAARIETLKALSEGAYPFVGTQVIARNGKVGKVSYAIDIRYPRFDGTTADFGAVNRSIADAAGKSAREHTPTADAGIDREQQWSYEQGFALYRPSPDVVTIAIGYYGFTGGAHGYGAQVCMMVDLRTGKRVELDEVFVGQWLESMVQLVGADLKKQFVARPGFAEALEPANLTKLLREAGHYCFRRDELELVFNQYEVGPYAAGRYEVEIPLAALKRHLRVDGPLSR